MTPLWVLPALVASYLIGSIPFGFLTAKLARGIDIRSVGSGNVGATNVGRVLGRRFFFLVLTLDLLKGLGPTLLFPEAVARVVGQPVPGLEVGVALAAVLGHNFSVFLKFQGGKGVATSLGALTALDPVAALAAVVGFSLVLGLFRYVSLASISGGTVFAVVHFALVARPWSRDERALTLLIVVLYVMLIFRHRSNLKRILAGTEPKVAFGRSRRAGSVRIAVVSALVIAGVSACAAAWLWREAHDPLTARVAGAELVQVARLRTGYQRAEALEFFDEGRGLVVGCPRYNAVVFYRLEEPLRKAKAREVELDGRPVAIQAAGEHIFILQRPDDDNRHLEEGYWEAFNFDGDLVGSKFRVGWDPDDLAIDTERGFAYVLTSGHAEGEEGRPDPALIVVRLGDQTERHRIIARVVFEGEGDDPERLILSSAKRYAAVALRGSDSLAAIDLTDPTDPRPIDRIELPVRKVPYRSAIGSDDAILMPVETNRDSSWITRSPGLPEHAIATTLPRASALEFIDGAARRPLGHFELRGPWNLGEVIPTGLAYAPERSLLAVVDRSGGVHLIRLESEKGSAQRLASDRERESKSANARRRR